MCVAHARHFHQSTSLASLLLVSCHTPVPGHCFGNNRLLEFSEFSVVSLPPAPGLWLSRCESCRSSTPWQVKASLLAGKSDVFEVSAAELQTAFDLGPRYWLARVWSQD